MKLFFRTIAGKTLIFILWTVSTAVLIVSVVFAMLMLQENVYMHTEREIVDRTMFGEYLNAGKVLVEMYAESKFEKDVRVADHENFIFEICKENHSVRSEGVSETASWRAAFFYVYRAKDREANLDSILNLPANWDSEKAGGADPSDLNSFHMQENRYAVRLALHPELPVQDKVWFKIHLIRIAYSLRYGVYVIAAIAAAVSLICFILLMCVSARRPHDDEIHPGVLNDLPFDVLLFAEGLCLMFCYIIMQGLTFRSGPLLLIPLAIFGIVLLALFLGNAMSIAARIKQKTLIKNNLSYFVLSRIWKGVRSVFAFVVRSVVFLLGAAASLCRRIRNLIFLSFSLPQLTAALAVLIFLEFLVLVGNASNIGGIFSFWFLKKLILIPLLIYLAAGMRRIEKGAAELASGRLGFRVRTEGLVWNLKRHAEHLNSISKGMHLAVEESVKSERMKTELIANVSHDIKTPLTSMISYAGLIRAEKTENPKITEYSEVLIKQSERLKHLLEDLVEASRVSTGNVELNLVPSDASLFLGQICGEYAGRLEEAGLTLVLGSSVGEGEVYLMADSRRMWRVFDNVMNNICKYSLAGTRVYIDLQRDGEGNVSFIFKNTSREPLNLSEEELFERFARGDRSRSTEGSGLGLSIAKSLVELQHGSMHIYTDGDLFKLVMCFPILSV